MDKPLSKAHGDGARRAGIAEIQRARLLSATFEVACELGAGNVSVAGVVERAGVSRRTFYELFSNCEDCLLAAFEQGVGLLGERVAEAYRAEGSWRDRTRAALAALLAFLDEQPLVARFLIVESHSAGADVAERRARALARLIDAIDQGRGETRAPSAVTPLAAEGIVGGALQVLHTRLSSPAWGGASGSTTRAAKRAGRARDRKRRGAPPLVALTNPLMHMIVLPYLGAAAATRELERPVPSGSAPKRRAALRSDPFRRAHMRVTYRTVRVLAAVAERPGASNRAIADAAEVGDQGQISKLLARLQRNGMVENAGPGGRTGTPNTWTLTAAGRRAVEGIRAHSDGQGPGG